jgi:AAT family amino acid transporter
VPAVQTYSVVVPRFRFMDFLSLYLQVPVFLILYFGWKVRRRSQPVDLKSVDLQADQYRADEETQAFFDEEEEHRQTRLRGTHGWRWQVYYWLV